MWSFPDAQVPLLSATCCMEFMPLSLQRIPEIFSALGSGLSSAAEAELKSAPETYMNKVFLCVLILFVLCFLLTGIDYNYKAQHIDHKSFFFSYLKKKYILFVQGQFSSQAGFVLFFFFFLLQA